MSEKHILVHWVEENTYSISSECFVKDKRCLTDDTLVGLVEHGDRTKRTPKDGWRSFPAKVLAISDNLDDIVSKENALTKRQLPISDSQSDSQPKKKKIRAGKETNTKPSNELDKQSTQRKAVELTTMNDGDAILKYTALLRVKEDEISALKTENARLREDNAELVTLRKMNLRLQKDLPVTIDSAIRSAITHHLAYSSTPTSPPASSPRPVHIVKTRNPSASSSSSSCSAIVQATTSSCPAIVQATTPLSHSASNPEVELTTSHDAKEVLIYAYLTQDAVATMSRAAGGEWSKLVYSLASALFSAEELTTSSVTGRTCGEAIRPSLDKGKVEAITDYLEAKFSIEKSRVRAKLAQKLKDVRLRQEEDDKKKELLKKKAAPNDRFNC